MGPKPHRRLTDAKWLFQYAVAKPKRALAYGTLAGLVILVVTAAVAIEAIPVWIGLLVAGPALTAVARESIQRARLLWAASKQSTGSVTGGTVAVSGQVVAANDRRLTSTYRDCECLAYESIEITQTNDGQGSTKSTQVKQNILPFYVDDGSGSVLVNTTTGTVTLKSEQTEESGSKRQEEGAIQEGDQVTVYGEIERLTPGSVLPGSEGSDTDPVVTTGTEYGDVVVTNRPGRRVLAGQIAYGLGWIGVGATLVVAAIALATGLVSV